MILRVLAEICYNNRETNLYECKKVGMYIWLRKTAGDLPSYNGGCVGMRDFIDRIS